MIHKFNTVIKGLQLPFKFVYHPHISTNATYVQHT